MTTPPPSTSPIVGEPVRNGALSCPGFRQLAGRCTNPPRRSGWCWRCWNQARRWAATAEVL